MCLRLTSPLVTAVDNIRWFEDQKMKIFEGLRVNTLNLFVDKYLEMKAYFEFCNETMKFGFLEPFPQVFALRTWLIALISTSRRCRCNTPCGALRSITTREHRVQCASSLTRKKAKDLCVRGEVVFRAQRGQRLGVEGYPDQVELQETGRA